MPTKKKVPATQEVPLSQRELARAATNDLSLSTDEFTLGERTFKILDLGYDDYVKFLALLQPLTEGLISKFNPNSFSIPDLQLDRISPTGLMKYCLQDLPEMARIVCSQTDPDITVDELKKLAGDPLTLCEVVLKQIVRNNMIGQISRFIKLILTLMPKKNQK